MEPHMVAMEKPSHSAYEKFMEITHTLTSETLSDKTPSDVEAYLETDGRELLRLLLQEHVDARGPGRVGDAVCGSDGVVRSHKRDHMEISSKSVFGAVQVERTGYGHRGVASLFPLDAQLHVPATASSHRLQKRVAYKAVKESFAGVSKEIEEDTGVRIGKRQVEEMVYGGAQGFEAFYAQQSLEEIRRQVQSKPIQVFTFDGKGVVMRTEALRESTRKKAEASAGKPPHGFSRTETSHRKRPWTVVGTYHIDRHMDRKCQRIGISYPCDPLVERKPRLPGRPRG